MPLSSPKMPLLEVSFLAELSTIEGILALVQEWAQEQGVHYDDRLSLRLVLEELLTNITLHNSPEHAEHTQETQITLSLRSGITESTKNIYVHIRDTGKAFNPLEFNAPPLDHIDTAPIGQRGLSFVHLLTRHTQYIRREGNEFFFTFSLADEKSRQEKKPLAQKNTFTWPNLKKFNILLPKHFFALCKERLALRQTLLITFYSIILIWGGMAIFYHNTQNTLQKNATQLAMQAMHTQDIVSSNFFTRVQKNLQRLAWDLQKVPVESLFAMNAKALTAFMQSTLMSTNIAAELPILGIVAGYKNTTWFYPMAQGKFTTPIPTQDVCSYINKNEDSNPWKILPYSIKKESPHASLVYAVPLDNQGEYMGFIGVIVGMDWISSGLRQLTNFNNAIALYFDHKGRYIIFPPNRQWGTGPQSLHEEAQYSHAPLVKQLEENILAGKSGILPLESLFPVQQNPWPVYWQAPTTLIYYPSKLPGKYFALLVDSHELGSISSPLPLGFILVAIFGPLCVAAITWVVIFLTLHPLQALTKGIEKLSDGDTESPFPTAPFPDELHMMLSTFERVRVTLRTSFHNLVTKTTKQQRLSNELAMARRTQKSMLPHTLPQVPGTQISACLNMAYEVCGDLYTSFVNPYNSKQIYFIVGDVCSKGIAAALIMSRTVSLANSFLLQESAQNVISMGNKTGKNTHINTEKKEEEDCKNSLCRSLEHLNASLLRNDTSGMFVSMLVACLDMQSGTFYWASAGHPPPVLSCPLTNQARHLPWSEELVLNVSPKQTYTTFTEQLVPGQSILLYTDGATEAMSPPNRIQGQLYGEDRLKRVFHTANRTAAHTEDIIHTIHKDIVAHMQGQAPNDDISLMAIRWQRPHISA